MSYSNNQTIPTQPSPGVNVNISNPNPMPSSLSSSSFNTMLLNPLLQPKHQVPRVNDEKDIYSLPMGIDSSDFVLHNTKPLIYFVATDNSGNKTSIMAFDIQQHIQEPEPTMQDVKAIESRLDEKLSAFKSEIATLISNKIDEALK